MNAAADQGTGTGKATQGHHVVHRPVAAPLAAILGHPPALPVQTPPPPPPVSTTTTPPQLYCPPPTIFNVPSPHQGAESFTPPPPWFPSPFDVMRALAALSHAAAAAANQQQLFHDAPPQQPRPSPPPPPPPPPPPRSHHRQQPQPQPSRKPAPAKEEPAPPPPPSTAFFPPAPHHGLVPAFVSVHDLIHAAIVSCGGRASLRQIYQFSEANGRIAYKRSEGSRLITSNNHWKSQIRHALYTTTGRFFRVNGGDCWSVCPAAASTAPAMTTVLATSTGEPAIATQPSSQADDSTDTECGAGSPKSAPNHPARLAAIAPRKPRSARRASPSPSLIATGSAAVLADDEQPPDAAASILTSLAAAAAAAAAKPHMRATSVDGGWPAVHNTLLLSEQPTSPRQATLPYGEEQESADTTVEEDTAAEDHDGPPLKKVRTATGAFHHHHAFSKPALANAAHRG